MKKVISSERKPIKLWLDDIEEGALDQAKNLANLPFVFKHIAIMPDAHQGYGMPIGGIMATRDVIVPNAVGVDIGCGMIAVKTSLTTLDKGDIKKVLGGSKEYKGGIRSNIPVGFNKHSKKQDINWMPDVTEFDESYIVFQEFEKARKQIGTLGGGNHFIEIQSGSDGFIWLMIHSGSRNIGFTVAHHYAKVAKQYNEMYYTRVPEAWDLAFLPLNTDQSDRYIKEMNYCIEFAYANRQHMMQAVQEALLAVKPGTEFQGSINIAHNYASIENHFGENVMVHRKGATKATKGNLGIIPGSQGSTSYIVYGAGNPDSFNSCSHGAGRLMSRKKAKKELNLADEKQRLDDLGVIHNIRNVTDLDEAPGAYKDITKVMANQGDLVDVLVELTPLAVVKG